MPFEQGQEDSEVLGGVTRGAKRVIYLTKYADSTLLIEPSFPLKNADNYSMEVASITMARAGAIISKPLLPWRYEGTTTYT